MCQQYPEEVNISEISQHLVYKAREENNSSSSNNNNNNSSSRRRRQTEGSQRCKIQRNRAWEIERQQERDAQKDTKTQREQKMQNVHSLSSFAASRVNGSFSFCHSASAIGLPRRMCVCVSE